MQTNLGCTDAPCSKNAQRQSSERHQALFFFQTTLDEHFACENAETQKNSFNVQFTSRVPNECDTSPFLIWLDALGLEQIHTSCDSFIRLLWSLKVTLRQNEVSPVRLFF